LRRTPGRCFILEQFGIPDAGLLLRLFAGAPA